eukprot:GHRQ01018985.1.p1 GENE.GHRQ01018985.1~~GHRQ01018985.1.p1  ORF type:complete len:124 (-),score=32.80 GHRQ01018985.1:607-978(-)
MSDPTVTCCFQPSCRPFSRSQHVRAAALPWQIVVSASAPAAAAGTFDPLYRLPLDVQSGELPVLPLSIAGAVSMTHLPDTESFLSGDEWFIYKFDKQQAGLSGGWMPWLGDTGKGSMVALCLQ